MPSTYTPIATNTLGSAASSVTFSSIPSTYTDLILIENYSLASSGSQSVVTLNGTSSTYSNTNLYGNGTSAFSSRFTGVGGFGSSPGIGDTANQIITMIRHFNNYSNSTTYKNCMQRKSDALDNTWATIGLWQSTSAITSITCTSFSGNYNSGSTFTLYGIKAA
jgi:hypothetical protein